MDFFNQFLQQLVNGLSLGGIYALIALGYTMVYGIVRLINFAHGEVLMLGAYAGYFVLTNSAELTPVTILLAFLLAMTLCAILGVVIDFLAYRPLRNSPRINSLITAIGLSILIQNVVRVIPFMGPNPRVFPTLVSGQALQLGGVSISAIQLIVMAVSLSLMLVLTFVVDFTKTGKAMRAVSYDMKAASLMGISVNRIIAFTFALGSALAAAGGLLFAAAYPQIDPTMGTLPGLKAFVAAVLGGIGSIPGAMLGGILMGVAEALTKGFISSQLSDAVVFGILIIILLVRPAGILGKNRKEKV